ncbi:MAG: TolC family protein, partial [Telluria sp.]
MQKSLIAVLLASAFVSLNAHAIDLIQVYQQALANDATYASARASLAAGRERVTQGRAGLLPTIGLSGSTIKNDSEFTPFNEGETVVVAGVPTVVRGGGSNLTTSEYTLALSQPLFRWDRW